MFIKSLGGTSISVGLIGGLRDSLSNLLKIVSGYFSDKMGKKKIFVISGYASSSICKLFFVLSKTWQQLLIFLSLERLGKGLRDAPRDALISISMTEEKGKAFGIHRALDTLGAILGSSLVFFLFWKLELSFQSIIIIATVIGFISLIPLYFVEETTKQPQKVIQTDSTNQPTKPLLIFIIISGIFALANFNYMFFILKTQEAFSGKAAIFIPLFVYVLFNIFQASFAIPLGIFYDKIGRKRIIISGYLLFAIITLGFVYFKTIWAFIILFSLYGISYAMLEGNQRAFVSDLSVQEKRATAIGAFYSLSGIMTLCSSVLAGILWQKINSNAPFIFASGASLTAAALFIGFRNYFAEKENPN